MTGTSKRRRPRLAALLAWAWVAAILGGYLHQFLPLLPNLLRALWPH